MRQALIVIAAPDPGLSGEPSVHVARDQSLVRDLHLSRLPASGRVPGASLTKGPIVVTNISRFWYLLTNVVGHCKNCTMIMAGVWQVQSRRVTNASTLTRETHWRWAWRSYVLQFTRHKYPATESNHGAGVRSNFVEHVMNHNWNDTGVTPVGDRVLIRRDPMVEMYKGSIVMLDGNDSWSWTGVILAIGPKVDDPDVIPGVRVLFQPKGSSALIPDTRENGPSNWERVVRVPLENVLGVIE